MSLFGEYIQEREGKHIVEDEKGFATYYFVMDGCYIEEIYVRPLFRNQDVASKMADRITLLTKEKGLKHLYGTVCPAARGSTESLKVLLAYGFKLHTSQPNLVVLKKEI